MSALKVVNIDPADAIAAIGSAANAGGSNGSVAPGAFLGATPTVAAQSGVSASPSVTEGLITPLNGSATYRVSGESAPLLVALQVLSPQPQGQWSLSVSDGNGRAIGSVTVPPGRRGIAVEIQPPGGGDTGPMTVTIAAVPGQSGPSAVPYVLGVEATGPASAPPPSAAGASGFDSLDYFFIIPNQGGDVLEESEQPAHSPGASGQGTGPPAATAVSTAPPSGQGDNVFAKLTPGGGGRVLPPVGALSDEQAEGGDSGRADQNERLAQSESPDASDPALPDRQLVDTPGGMPGADAAPGTRGTPALRLAERRRPGPPSIPGGPVALSTALAAGLIVPNVLLMGGPRSRLSRYGRRLVFQRRASG